MGEGDLLVEARFFKNESSGAVPTRPELARPLDCGVLVRRDDDVEARLRSDPPLRVIAPKRTCDSSSSNALSMRSPGRVAPGLINPARNGCESARLLSFEIVRGFVWERLAVTKFELIAGREISRSMERDLEGKLSASPSPDDPS